jgi:hypothetical protein
MSGLQQFQFYIGLISMVWTLQKDGDIVEAVFDCGSAGKQGRAMES